MTYEKCINHLFNELKKINEQADIDESKDNTQQEAHDLMDKIYFKLIPYFEKNFRDSWTTDHGDVQTELGDAIDIAQFIRYGNDKSNRPRYRNQWTVADGWFSFLNDPHCNGIPSDAGRHLINLYDIKDVTRYLAQPFTTNDNQ